MRLIVRMVGSGRLSKWTLLYRLAKDSFSPQFKGLAILWAFYLAVAPPPTYRVLQTIGSECESVLDIGCGRNSFTSNLGCSVSVGVEAWLPDILEAKGRGTHDHFVVARAERLCFAPKSFDCVLALDVIEHLTRREGFSLIEEMETIARRKIVIFTPNGFVPQRKEGSPLQFHKSGWTVKDFKAMGFKITGVRCPRAVWFRRNSVVDKSKISSKLREIGSNIFHFLGTDPEMCFQLLCVKSPRDR
jgi:hypothetical protein